MQEIISKKSKDDPSKEQHLVEHSKMCEKVANILLKDIVEEDLYKELYESKEIEKIRIAALIHDIGKCVKPFQNYIKNKENAYEGKEIIYHNEYSWAISHCLFEKGEYSYMRNAIYWHHAEVANDNSKKKSVSLILQKIDNDELETIYDQLKELIPNYLKEDLKSLDDFKQMISNEIKYGSDINTPTFFSYTEKSKRNIIGDSKDKDSYYMPNVYNILYRSILITSDRISSKIFEDSSSEKWNELFQNDTLLSEYVMQEKRILQATIPSFYDENRINKQKEIINKCNNKKTSVIKAPAGFGKTLTGILWTIERPKKLLWVCPRNVIVESVYNSILSELDAIGLKEELSVEVFLAGERKLPEPCNDDEQIPKFCSDIVITNIDNFLSPIYKNKSGIWAADILSRDVVFDEYHEFVSDSALYAAFIEIMKLRHTFIKSGTLLLSATPSLIHTLWDTDNETQILPEKDSHYPAVHNKKYCINFIEDTGLCNEKNSLIITNSIHNSQLYRKHLNTDILIHSKFIKNDFDEILKDIWSKYKKNAIEDDKPSVSSALILQASCDISFKTISKSLLSPESDLQSIGRCNRWGEYGDCESKINFFRITGGIEKEGEGDSVASNKEVIKNNYDISLNEKWGVFLKSKVKPEITLDELYEIYNGFNIENGGEIRKFLEAKLKDSICTLSKIKPIKQGKSKKTSCNKSNSIPTIRTDGISIYVAYKVHDEDEYEIFKEEISKENEIIDRGIKFGEDEVCNIQNKANETIKQLIEKGIYNPNKKIKEKLKNNNLDLETLYIYAKRKDMPYVAFNKEYSKDFGLAKKGIYNNN